MRRIIVIVSLAAIVVTAVAVINLRRNAGMLGVDWRIKKSLPTKKVRVDRAKRSEIIQTVTAPGTIELVEEANIASQIMGQVDAVSVEKGDLVKKDDLLVKLDGEDAKASLESTEARIERLKAAIELAEADLSRAEVDSAGVRRLEARGFSTPNEVLDGETTLTKMQAALEMSQHELKESFAMLRSSVQAVERTEIRAPMDGTVIDLDVEVGEIVIAGTTNLPGTVLMTIGDMSMMRVRADVDETDVGLVRAAQKVRIYLQADQAVPVPGVVDLISPKGTKIAEVVSFETLIAVVGKHAQLRPEMTATVEIEVKRADNALSVPVQAVVHRRFQDLPDTPLFRDWLKNQPTTPAEKGKELAARYIKVIFVKEDGVARAKPVETGINDQERIEILGGINADDDLIVGPFRTLDEMVDGQPVELEKVDTKKKVAKKSKDTSEKIEPPAKSKEAKSKAAESEEAESKAAESKAAESKESGAKQEETEPDQSPQDAQEPDASVRGVSEQGA